MGAGDQHSKPRFTVPAGPSGPCDWPFRDTPGKGPTLLCKACGAMGEGGRSHPARDGATTVSYRVCFGLMKRGEGRP